MGDIASILPEFSTPVPPLTEALAGDPLLAGYLRSAREHLGLEIGFISRWVDGDSREITHVDTQLDLPIGPGFRQHRDETYCWHILNGRLPELIPDTGAQTFAQGLHITNALPVGCSMAVPLRLSGGTVWGSFSIIARLPDPTLNQRDLAILESFATMAAERIEHLIDEAARREQTSARIDDMFAGDSVTIYQQPIHAFDHGIPVGVECLARFPDINKRGPGVWFEDAERAGLGEKLELTAVRGALDTLASVPEGFFASVKAPARSVLTGAVRGELANCDAANVVITLTQYRNVEEVDELAVQMLAFRPRAKIAIDGVGLDFSSLELVAAIRPDYIKLDMALTRGIADSLAGRSMVSAIVELARTVSATVIAEGIEQAAEAATMQGLGVTCGQGYLFARPLPIAAAEQHLRGICA